MSFSPQTQLAYIPALEASSYYKHDDAFQFRDHGEPPATHFPQSPANGTPKP